MPLSTGAERGAGPATPIRRLIGQWTTQYQSAGTSPLGTSRQPFALAGKIGR
jgi:hypothetical protein